MYIMLLVFRDVLDYTSLSDIRSELLYNTYTHGFLFFCLTHSAIIQFFFRHRKRVQVLLCL